MAIALHIIGVVLALLATWPMSYALDAAGSRDYLACGLLLGLTWALARTGLELVASGRLLLQRAAISAPVRNANSPQVQRNSQEEEPR